jgi:uncharacterized membrane protein YedE/YeeE
MKSLRYVLYGIVFSIILIKVEAISWFRIQEMFYFQSFHMYGVLISGIAVAFVGIKILKKSKGIETKPKELQLTANILGGLSFGVGWGITGACSGPLYSLIGLQIWPATVVLGGALLGTFVYGFTKRKLPHNYAKRNKTNTNTDRAYS